MAAHCSRPSGVLGAKELSQQQNSHGQLSFWGVPHGVRVVQNGRPVLEDAFSHASLEVEPAGQPYQAAAGAGACVNPTTGPGSLLQQPLSFFGVYDGHGGADVAHHAAAKLHQHFQAAYKQLATAAQLAGAGSGSACSASSSVTLEEMLCDPWHSSSSSSNSLTSDSTNSSGGTLADVLVSIASGSHAGPAGAATDLLSCSSPSSTASSNGGSPTCQQVWDTLNSPTAGALLPAAGSASLRHKQLKQHQQQQAQAQQPSRASRVVVQALREAFLRTDADLAGTEVGEVVGTTAVTAVMSEGELFIGHCGDSRAVLCRKGQAVPLTNDHKPGRPDEMARVSALGGKIVYKAGSHRVMGLLAMSRALGDHFLRPYVIAEPEVLCLQRCPEDELLILATDGLWDVFSCQEAATLALRSTVRARQRGASSSAACRVGASVLVRGAIERGSRDNITVAVIDLRARQEEEGGRVASVASVLASQCSSDLAGWAALAAAAAAPNAQQQQQQGGSRKRRSSSGNEDEDQQQDAASHAPAQPAAHHHAGSSNSSAASQPSDNTAAGAGLPPTQRRHTTNGIGPAAHEAAAAAGGQTAAGAGTGGGSGAGRSHPSQGVSWGWSLQQGLQMLPHSRDSPSSSIRALAQAAAAAVAAFSGTMSGVDRSVSGIPREVATGRGSTTGAAGAGTRTAPTAAAAPGDRVSAPATPTMADLLSMQSAPPLRHSSGGGSSISSGGGAAPRGSSAGKPPLPHHQAQRGSSAAGTGVQP